MRGRTELPGGECPALGDELAFTVADCYFQARVRCTLSHPTMPKDHTPLTLRDLPTG
jgi:hypothetical protein